MSHFKITHLDGSARVGLLQTTHGIIETPFYMPCATKATGKLITTDDYRNANVKVLIANALLLSLRPGIDIIRKGGGLHSFMNFNGAIFTDCGGFQSSRSIFEKKNKKGLYFRSPYDQQQILLTPEEIMNIEITIDSDVAMMLDDMSLFGISKEDARIAMENTHLWGADCLKIHKKLKKERKSSQLLFGIVQGNFYPDLREESARFISSLDFDGIAIGGLAIGEPKEEMYKALNAAIPYIRQDKPHYVMGVGTPVDILECIEKGIDCFDSVYPTQVARHGTLLTWKGKLDLKQKKYAADFTPIEQECRCHTCQHYTKAYLHHLSKIEEPIGKRLNTIHNVFFMQEFMERVKEAIKMKKFKEFKDEFLQIFSALSIQ